ncbi:MAG TPA: iron ABC transporter permease [Candidatus Dormibacteraeota bacterium]|nr:iron ABC transporter permease [Candidatus Dormibacteraeota bacterium]
MAATGPITLRRVVSVTLLLLLTLVVVGLAALRLGPVPISTANVAGCLLRAATGHMQGTTSDCRMIVLDLRLPRVLLALLVGAGLSVTGAGFQALLRNPLADPYILGVSSGAALGAVLALLVAPQTSLATMGAAFAGALLTVAAVYLLGRRGGHLDSYTLLLAGVITASFFSAVIMFLMASLPGRDLRGMAFWLMGDLSSPLPVRLGWLMLVTWLAIGAIYTTAADLNLLAAGEQEAMHLGVNVGRVKLVVYLAGSLLTALAVAVSGAIGYIGLLVPHVMRMLFGSDYRLLIPASALGGAIALIIADTLARTVVAPTELPVGAMTAIAGAPVFIYLLRKKLG